MEEFAGVSPYELRGVQVADVVIGHGSYATVHELKYMGLKCAGKKIHKELSSLPATVFTGLLKSATCLVEFDIQTLYSFWASISRKENKYPS